VRLEVDAEERLVGDAVDGEGGADEQPGDEREEEGDEPRWQVGMIGCFRHAGGPFPELETLVPDVGWQDKEGEGAEGGDGVGRDETCAGRREEAGERLVARPEVAEVERVGQAGHVREEEDADVREEVEDEKAAQADEDGGTRGEEPGDLLQEGGAEVDDPLEGGASGVGARDVEREEEGEEEPGHQERRVDGDGEPLCRQVEEDDEVDQDEEPDGEDAPALEEAEEAPLPDREAAGREAEREEEEGADEEAEHLEVAGIGREAVVERQDGAVEAVRLEEDAEGVVGARQGEGDGVGAHREVRGEGLGVEARVREVAGHGEGRERPLGKGEGRAGHVGRDEADEVEDVRQHPVPRHLGEAGQVFEDEEEVAGDQARIPPLAHRAEEDVARAGPVEEVGDERPAHDLLEVVPERAEELEEVEHLKEDDDEEEELVDPPSQPALRHAPTSPVPAERRV